MEERVEVMQQENKMGTMPIGKLLFSMSLPIILSMLVQALYNIVDSIFVARISEDALTAVSMAAPIQTLFIAVGAGTGVGVNALLSRALGEGDPKKASKIGKNGIFLAAASYVVFLIFGIIGVRGFYAMQTDSADIIQYGTEYLSIVCCLSVGLFMQIIFERLLQATGRTVYTMCIQLLGAVINIILDPILIFGWFGLPAMGVTGAALATVIGQIVGATVGFFINRHKNPEIDVRMKGFRPCGQTIRQIYQIGVPSILMQAIGAVTTFLINKILIGFTTTAVAVYGIYFKLNMFVFMGVLGINNGMVPIISYNYGARNKERMMKTVKLALISAVGILSAGTILLELIPRTILTLFNASEHMYSMGVPAIRVIALHLPVAAVVVIFGSVLQAIGRAFYSMLASLCRQLIVLVPAIYVLSLFGEVNYVWYAFLFAETIAAIISCIFFAQGYRKIIKPLGVQR